MGHSATYILVVVVVVVVVLVVVMEFGLATLDDVGVGDGRG